MQCHYDDLADIYKIPIQNYILYMYYYICISVFHEYVYNAI